MATNYSVFIKLNLSGATKLNADFKKVISSTEKATKNINTLNTRFKAFSTSSSTATNKVVGNLKRIDTESRKASASMKIRVISSWALPCIHQGSAYG